MTDAAPRLAPGREHLVCGACPSLALPLGNFDVVPKPSKESAYERAHGYRVLRDGGTPVCVHPDRVGLPAGAYASAGVPLPGAGGPADPPPLPEAADGLDQWLLTYLGGVETIVFEAALQRAHETAATRFAPDEVLTALRRVLGSGRLS
ncbi:hypothetical protein [Streptomyces chrestomyceticus]|uniref:hypothetical protein n=1 Tax=Streptomyces chrestomyceticus TaxID=68185 RepID=UPI0034070244